MEKMISYTFWGEGIGTNWYEWYMYVDKLFEKVGYNITHIGIKSQSYMSNKILTAKRKEKEIIQILKEGDNPSCFECYSLPSIFEVAAFDYNILCVRTDKFISLVLQEKDLNKLDERTILEMKKYIYFSCGEVYTTLKNEVPLLYAYTKNISSLESFEFVKNI